MNTIINKKLVLLCASVAMLFPGASFAINIDAIQYAGVPFTPTCDHPLLSHAYHYHVVQNYS